MAPVDVDLWNLQREQGRTTAVATGYPLLGRWASADEVAGLPALPVETRPGVSRPDEFPRDLGAPPDSR